MSNTYRIVITGAESSGKSTLAQQLATHYGAIWIPEYARKYVAELNRPYTYNDVEKIAQQQIEELNQHYPAQRVVFFDTGLIITKIWFEEVFNAVPQWLLQAIEEQPVDYFLLCHTDIDWHPDPLRENGGPERLLLQQRYENDLMSYGLNYQRVDGHGKQRLHNAIAAIGQRFPKLM